MLRKLPEAVPHTPAGNLVTQEHSEDRELCESGSRAREPRDNAENRKKVLLAFPRLVSEPSFPTVTPGMCSGADLFQLRLAHLCCDNLFVRTHHLTSSLWPA